MSLDHELQSSGFSVAPMDLTLWITTQSITNDQKDLLNRLEECVCGSVTSEPVVSGR